MVGQGSWQKCPGNDIDNSSQGRAIMSSESSYCSTAVLVFNLSHVKRFVAMRVESESRR